MDGLFSVHKYHTELCSRITRQDDKLLLLAVDHPDGRLLKSISSVCDMTAGQCLADLGSVKHYQNGRNLAAWLGLIPLRLLEGSIAKVEILQCGMRGFDQQAGTHRMGGLVLSTTF